MTSGTRGGGGDVRAWITIVAMTLVVMLTGGLLFPPLGLFAAPWMAQLHAKVGEAMAVSTFAAVGAGFFGIAVGGLAAKLPARLLMLVGISFVAAALFFASMADSIWVVLIVITLVGGAGGALCSPLVGQSVAVRLLDKPGPAIAMVALGLTIGAVLFPPVLIALMERFDWRTTMRIMAGIVLLALPIIALIQEPPREPATIVAEKKATLGLGAIVRDPVFIGILLAGFPIAIIASGIFFNLGLYIAERNGPLAAAGLIMSLSAVAGVLSTMATGALSDRIDHRWLLGVAFVCPIASLLLLAHGVPIPLLSLVVALSAIAASIVIPLIPAVLARRFDEDNFPRAIGAAQPVLFGNTVGAMLFGAARDSLGSYSATFTAMLGLMVVSGVGFAIYWFGLSTKGAAAQPARAQPDAAG